MSSPAAGSRRLPPDGINPRRRKQHREGLLELPTAGPTETRFRTVAEAAAVMRVSR
jgi:hypothetical protein